MRKVFSLPRAACAVCRTRWEHFLSGLLALLRTVVIVLGEHAQQWCRLCVVRGLKRNVNPNSWLRRVKRTSGNFCAVRYRRAEGEGLLVWTVGAWIGEWLDAHAAKHEPVGAWTGEWPGAHAENMSKRNALVLSRHVVCLPPPRMGRLLIACCPPLSSQAYVYVRIRGFERRETGVRRESSQENALCSSLFFPIRTCGNSRYLCTDSDTLIWSGGQRTCK